MNVPVDVIRQWENELADPQFSRPGRVDAPLEVDFYHPILRQELPVIVDQIVYYSPTRSVGLSLGVAQFSRLL